MRSVAFDTDPAAEGSAQRTRFEKVAFLRELEVRLDTRGWGGRRHGAVEQKLAMPALCALVK
jgi:hypothetical protein